MLTYLAIFAALNAAVGVFYYLRVVVAIYLKASDEPPALVPPVASHGSWPLKASVLACVFGTVVVGLFPGTVSQPAQRSALASIKLNVQKPDLTKATPKTAQNAK